MQKPWFWFRPKFGKASWWLRNINVIGFKVYIGILNSAEVQAQELSGFCCVQHSCWHSFDLYQLALTLTLPKLSLGIRAGQELFPVGSLKMTIYLRRWERNCPFLLIGLRARTQALELFSGVDSETWTPRCHSLFRVRGQGIQVPVTKASWFRQCLQQSLQQSVANLNYTTGLEVGQIHG